MKLSKIYKALLSYQDTEKQKILPRFFKTGKGEYGEGDLFIGVTVPNIRIVAKEFYASDLTFLTKSLKSPYHEVRMCVLIVLVERYKKAKTNEERKEIFDFYLSHTQYINNWDLVDLTAPHIVGAYLKERPREILYLLAESESLWEQRISIISTFAFIKNNDFYDTLAISEKLLIHNHDLIHKACGWMLREVGKRNKEKLLLFLDEYNKKMPRTMLRYSLEKLSKEEREHYMKK